MLRSLVATALACILLSACSEPVTTPAPATAPVADDIDPIALLNDPVQKLDVEAFTKVLPFRTDVTAALAELPKTGRPGLLFYADPT